MIDDIAYLKGIGLAESDARAALRALFAGQHSSGMGRDELAEVPHERLVEIVGEQHADSIARLLDAER